MKGIFLKKINIWRKIIENKINFRIGWLGVVLGFFRLSSQNSNLVQILKLDSNTQICNKS